MYGCESLTIKRAECRRIDDFVLWCSVQFSSVTQPCLTLCNHVDGSTPGLLVHHQLPEFTQTRIHWVGNAIQPSHPLLSPSPPAFNLFQHQSLFKWVFSSHQVAKVLEFQLQHQSFQRIFRTVVLEKTFESPYDCKEIKPVNSKGNQSWIFIGQTGAEAEAPKLCSPDTKSQLTGKDSDAGKGWGQEKTQLKELITRKDTL